MRFKIFKNKEKTQENAILKSQKRQEKSRGRSMVEMLGVLAIIGVLSIGGISGYTIAMRKYRANEILNVASKYAALLWIRGQQKLLSCENQCWYSPSTGSVLPHLPENYKTDELYYFGPNFYINFADAGLGALPSGVTEFFVESISASKSGMIVTIEISTKDKSLCETIKTQTEYTMDSYNADVSCSQNHSPYNVWIAFPQS